MTPVARGLRIGGTSEGVRRQHAGSDHRSYLRNEDSGSVLREGKSRTGRVGVKEVPISRGDRNRVEGGMVERWPRCGGRIAKAVDRKLVSDGSGMGGRPDSRSTGNPGHPRCGGNLKIEKLRKPSLRGDSTGCAHCSRIFTTGGICGGNGESNTNRRTPSTA